MAYGTFHAARYGQNAPLWERLRQTDQIDPDLYRKYEVKRGLRDLDGRGVLWA
jgi:hypothetical protein